MPTKRPDRGLDFSQNALRVVREATGQIPKSEPPVRTPKNKAAVALSKLGASKGGKARAAKMTAKQLSAAGSKAARARWKRNTKT